MLRQGASSSALAGSGVPQAPAAPEAFFDEDAEEKEDDVAEQVRDGCL